MSTLPECIKCGNYIHSGFVVCDTCNDELPTIRTELTQLRAENAALKAERQWIPVSERLPEVSENFLVRITDGQTIWHDVGLYSRMNNKWWCSVFFEKEQTVTHWMPFPPAPDNKEQE